MVFIGRSSAGGSCEFFFEAVSINKTLRLAMIFKRTFTSTDELNVLFIYEK